MAGRAKTSGEFELIERFFAPLSAAEPGAFGLTDDAAVIGVEPGHTLVVTTDTLISGVHFRAEDEPSNIAAKALRVNLSDLAAMGARPLAYTLSTAFPAGQGVREDWLRSFADALGDDQARFGVTLIGGDTVATPGPLTLTVTAMGTAREGTVLRRSAARPGDIVYVSGTIGDGALGLLAVRGELAELDSDMGQALAGRYHRPTPRIELGCRLVGLAHAALDVSDGLVADMGHICKESRVGATIEAARVPLSLAGGAAVAADPSLLVVALTGGDDYELLFTAPPATADALARLSGDLKVPVTAIGRVDAGAGVRIIDETGHDLSLGADGYRHF
jgi:thiamine-monophosphate kinase